MLDEKSMTVNNNSCALPMYIYLEWIHKAW